MFVIFIEINTLYLNAEMIRNTEKNHIHWAQLFAFSSISLLYCCCLMGCQILRHFLSCDSLVLQTSLIHSDALLEHLSLGFCCCGWFHISTLMTCTSKNNSRWGSSPFSVIISPKFCRFIPTKNCWYDLEDCTVFIPGIYAHSGHPFNTIFLFSCFFVLIYNIIL